MLYVVVKQNGAQRSLAEMLSRPGDNQAKLDVQKFIESNRETFNAYDWSICKSTCLHSTFWNFIWNSTYKLAWASSKLVHHLN